MGLDLDLLLRNPDQIRTNQAQRYISVEPVDTVYNSEIKRTQLCKSANDLNEFKNVCSEEVGKRMTAGKLESTVENSSLKDSNTVFDQLSQKLVPSNLNDNVENVTVFRLCAETLEAVEKLTIDQIKELISIVDKALVLNKKYSIDIENVRNSALSKVGNLLHYSVPVSNSNIISKRHIERTFGDCAVRKIYSQDELIYMIDGIDSATCGIAGGRGYFLKGPAVFLQTALVQLALKRWHGHGFETLYPPYFMRKEVLQEVAQLTQSDEELYKVVGEGEDAAVQDDKYSIATAEQLIAALHRDQYFVNRSLPIQYVTISTCFRQEVGSHGKDTSGVFGVHKFEKVEQFILTSSFFLHSSSAFDKMIYLSEQFYKDLGIAYRIVSIVSAALNLAATKTHSLEAWLPGSGAFRELASCSDCLDYQARSLNVKYGRSEKMDEYAEYVHTMNSTVCATTSVICAILETYQTETGIEIPEILKPYMPESFHNEIPFVKPAPIDVEQRKRELKRMARQEAIAKMPPWMYL